MVFLSDKEQAYSYDELLKSLNEGAVYYPYNKTSDVYSYFVNLINKDFNLEFLIEEYNYDTQKRGIFANILNSDRRDDKLDDLINYNWIDGFNNIDVNVETIESKPAGSLTHWRVLNFEYNGKRLSIYPDGGLLNGWKLGRLNGGKRYEYDNTSTDDNIPLQRQNVIKFEVHIEDF